MWGYVFILQQRFSQLQETKILHTPVLTYTKVFFVWHLVKTGKSNQLSQKYKTVTGTPLEHIWGSVEDCYSPWSPWCRDATALAGYATLTVISEITAAAAAAAAGAT